MFRVVNTVPLLVLSVALALTAPPALAAENATGLDRAMEVASSTLENALANAGAGDAAAQESRVKGLERAQAAIDAALARGNGNGNGFGRGHSAEVHAILLAGGSPSELAGSHGQAVREMVHAYNALRKELRISG